MTDNQALTLALNAHYAPEDVSNRILAAVRVAGLDPQQLSRDAAALWRCQKCAQPRKTQSPTCAIEAMYG